MKLKEIINSYIMKDTDIAWHEFINNGSLFTNPKKREEETTIPKCSEIYISTKTKIAYISDPVDLNKIFWKIKILPYHYAQEGVLKKQMKTVCTSLKESETLNKLIESENDNCINVNVIKMINNPTARKIKYKDIRKINIGLSKKDLTSYRIKKKGAFYNCIVLIIRLKIDQKFKEFHLKVFNTGKLEIPGIQKETSLYMLLNKLITILQPFHKKTLTWKKENIETVLINSNFNCGFYLDRTKLYKILKYKYKIHALFDSCSYPGIQCKFYYNTSNKNNDGRCICPNKCNKKGNGKEVNNCLEVSFMIFRTGSVLIVGHCTEKILKYIYAKVKKLLADEYNEIKISYVPAKRTSKKKHIRKKIILQKSS